MHCCVAGVMRCGVLGCPLLRYSGCAQQHDTYARNRTVVHPRSAPRVRAYVYLSMQAYTNAKRGADGFICARMVTLGATTAWTPQN